MRDYLGELEHVVLLAVLRLEGEAYGVTIRDEIRQQTGRVISPGTIYPTLDRLERQGLVRSQTTEPSAVRGGRSRRVYELRPKGLAALRETHGMLRALGKGLDSVLSRPGDS